MMATRSLFHCTRAEREGILDALRRGVDARPDVVFAYVHGSFVERRPFHDVDVAVYLDPTAARDTNLVALQLAADLEKTLSRLVGDRAHVPVDVRVLNEAPLGFLYHAFRGRLLLSRDEALRVEQVERTVRRYLDLRPLRRHALKEAMTA